MKQCRYKNSNYQKEYYLKNRDKILKQHKEYNIIYTKSTHCKNNVKKRQKKMRTKLQIIMRELKVNGCAICGYNKCTQALDFHHVNPKDKCFPLSITYLVYTNERIANELNKCILLCKNCHTEVEYAT